MVNELIQAVGLGIAGIDPLGAILLFSAIRTGASRIKIVAFTASTFVTTIVAGVTTTVAGNRIVESVSVPLELSSESSPIWACIEIGVALLIGYWLIRARNNHGLEKKHRDLGGPTSAYVLAGVVFSATAVVDPTFLATAVVFADADDAFIIIIAFTVWTLTSQFMLFALFAAYLYGVDQHLVTTTMQLWQRHRRLFRNILYAAGVLAVLLLLADAIYYIINGSYFSW